MPAYISCRPWSYDSDLPAGCFVVCAAHDLRVGFGSTHTVAHAACVEHNALHHPVRQRSAAPLLSVIYESVASSEFQQQDLLDLLVDARANNRAFGITGMLLAEDGWFLQALEGPSLIVENLLDTIRRDPRHGHFRVLNREFRQQRRFPDWAMAEGHIGEVESRPLAQYYEGLLFARADADIE